MDADLPDVKSAVLIFKVCAFYRHFGKYFLFVCICLFAVQTFTDVCNFRLTQFLEKQKKKILWGNRSAVTHVADEYCRVITQAVGQSCCG